MFTALTRLSYGSAKDLSEVTDVPRTRVYDAIEQLQRDGLVDVQQSTPQQFRAVSITEATALLRQRFDTRLNRLQTSLDALEPIEANTRTPPLNVWTTTGSETITRRMIDFLDRAADEIILIVNGEPVITDRLLDRVRAASNRGVEIYVGTLSEGVHDRLRTMLPDVTLFESELDWLQPRGAEDESIGRLLLVDRETLLVSSIGHHSPVIETALWSEGVDNGLLVIARRLLATGLDPERGMRETTRE
ncbi:TrmB family transcriptional regulator [Halocatena marina]|uniref:TrmB family transcriptional regulator n=1 Tax=Halocatena marina TaxID=2934937 RepID=UPI00200F1B61|nr:helix-turn-helix domain-containing protein [Halocatena marina]